jgi:hypothetical protein
MHLSLALTLVFCPCVSGPIQEPAASGGAQQAVTRPGEAPKELARLFHFGKQLGEALAPEISRGSIGLLGLYGVPALVMVVQDPVEAKQRPAKSEDLSAVAKRIEQLTAEAEALTKTGDLQAARKKCKAALAIARLAGATGERIAALHKELWSLGCAADDAEDPYVASAAWEAVYRHRVATLPDEHPDLQDARQNLAITKMQLGDLSGANALFEKVYAVCSKTLPDEHPDLQDARENLAATKAELGDLKGALALDEKVYAVLSKTLPDEHPDLQGARQNLGATKLRLGDLPGANALFEKVHAVLLKTLPDEHPDLQKARQNLALTKAELGDLPGALALEEKVYAVLSKTLPDEHPDLQSARQNLAATKAALGGLPGALALEEKVYALLSKTLPDEHPYLQAARQNLAATKAELGDLKGALALEEKVYAVRSKTLSDEHPDLQIARQNLGATKLRLGDLPGANALFEKVHAVLLKTLPDEHPDLQKARQNLAVTKRKLGDLKGALALEEKVYAVLSKTLPDEHPYLQAARQNLAATKAELGDLKGALALEEKVYAVRSKTLSDEHPDLQIARQNLGATKLRLGDLPGANALFEKVHAVLLKTLPDEHPDLQKARQNLALTKAELGDLPGALALEEKVYAVLSKTLPDEHPDLQAARLNLAVTKAALGDLKGALALEEKVYALLSKTLPDEHPDLQAARQNLATTKAKLGDLEGALALAEKVYALLSKTLPDEHPDLQIARQNLAVTKQSLGDLPAAARLHRSAVAGALRRLSTQSVSGRDILGLAQGAAEPISHIASLLDLRDQLPEASALELRRDALSLLVATRSAELQLAGLRRAVREQHPKAFARLTRQLTEASRQLERAIALPPEGRSTPDGRSVTRDDAIRKATLQKDGLERELLALVPPGKRVLPELTALAGKLAADEAAVAFFAYTRWVNDPDKPWIRTGEARYGAFVVSPAGEVTCHSLAPRADIHAQIEGVRSDALAGKRLDLRSTETDPDELRGERVGKRPGTRSSLAARLDSLRELLLEPVLGAVPQGTRRLVVSLSGDLSLLPFDALLRSGDPQLEIVWSLRELTNERREVEGEPTVLTLGSVDYDSAPLEAAPRFDVTATPILEDFTKPQPVRSAEADTPATRGRKPKHFAALANTEARQVGTLFIKAFPTAQPAVLTGQGASEAAFATGAPGKTYLHLATHGYFAPESAWKATEARDETRLARCSATNKDRVGQLSPYSLCGVALAGANLPANEIGRREGILTAQEIGQIDLSSCYLATLSACNTSLGIRRAGAKLASLRSAFHSAGARHVLSTLWEIHDAQAQQLMADFYNRLWKQGQDPRAALRGAQQAARKRGAPFRDWAGWVLTGR